MTVAVWMARCLTGKMNEWVAEWMGKNMGEWAGRWIGDACVIGKLGR